MGASTSHKPTRALAATFFISWILFQATWFAGNRPDPLRFYFNLAPTHLSATRAAGHPGFAHRWVRVRAELGRRFFYRRENYFSGFKVRGCRTYLLGTLRSSGGGALPFRVLVEEEPAAPCRKEGVAPVPAPYRMPPHHIARIAPGDFSMRRIFNIKSANDFEQYLKSLEPEDFTGILRAKGIGQIPRELTKGEQPRFWLEVGNTPDFFNAICFQAMLFSGAGMFICLLRRRKRGTSGPAA